MNVVFSWFFSDDFFFKCSTICSHYHHSYCSCAINLIFNSIWTWTNQNVSSHEMNYRYTFICYVLLSAQASEICVEFSLNEITFTPKYISAENSNAFFFQSIRWKIAVGKQFGHFSWKFDYIPYKLMAFFLLKFIFSLGFFARNAFIPFISSDMKRSTHVIHWLFLRLFMMRHGYFNYDIAAITFDLRLRHYVSSHVQYHARH